MPIGFHDRVYSILRRLSRYDSAPTLVLGTTDSDKYIAFIVVPETLEVLFEGTGVSIEDAILNLFDVMLEEGEFRLVDLRLLNKRVCMFWIGGQTTGGLLPILRRFTTSKFIRIAPDPNFNPPHFSRKTALFALIDKASQKGSHNFYSRF